MKTKTKSKTPSLLPKIIVAICGSALCCLILLKTPLWGTALLLTLVTALAGFELAVPTGFVKNKFLIVLTVLQAAAVPWAFYAALPVTLWVLWLFGALMICFLPTVFSEKGPDVREVIASIFAALVFPMIISLFLELQRMDNGNVYVLIPLVVAWSCDALALIIGMAIGKHKLLPRISPNKTVEGFFGGICGGILGMMVYGLILHQLGKTVNFPLFAVLGACGSLFGVFGDLTLSAVKRSCGIKDFSRLLPGHGGILDRFDSVLFVLPFCYAVLLLCSA